MKISSLHWPAPDLRSWMLQFDQVDVAANSLAFLMGAFETSANTMSYILYKLALRRDIQDKLRQEIQKNVGKGNLCFEAVLGMKYLDMIFKETLRKYPPVPFIDRVSKNRTPCLAQR